MKVRVNHKKISEIENPGIQGLLQDLYYVNKGEYFVSIGQEFTVYGIRFLDNYPFLYIVDDPHINLPIAYPMDLFEVIDPRLSKYWQLSTYILWPEHPLSKLQTYLAFKEWAEDPFFIANLIDSEPRNIEIFEKYKVLMDCEYTSGQYTQMVFEFLFKGSRPRKPLELLCTLRAIRESYVVHQFKWPC